MFYIIGKYSSKYGVICYCAKVSSLEQAISIDLNNCYIHTLYFKGSTELKVGECYNFQTVKGENGFTYAFL